MSDDCCSSVSDLVYTKVSDRSYEVIDTEHWCDECKSELIDCRDENEKYHRRVTYLVSDECLPKFDCPCCGGEMRWEDTGICVPWCRDDLIWVEERNICNRCGNLFTVHELLSEFTFDVCDHCNGRGIVRKRGVV
jgi:hypothetical protein